MPKRRLQCGSCATVIKVSSRVQRPICPRCDTAHTFIKCGRGECGTLMCLPENVNHFSCPRFAPLRMPPSRRPLALLRGSTNLGKCLPPRRDPLAINLPSIREPLVILATASAGSSESVREAAQVAGAETPRPDISPLAGVTCSWLARDTPTADLRLSLCGVGTLRATSS
jgi:hypothetical protein